MNPEKIIKKEIENLKPIFPLLITFVSEEGKNRFAFYGYFYNGDDLVLMSHDVEYVKDFDREQFRKIFSKYDTLSDVVKVNGTRVHIIMRCYSIDPVRLAVYMYAELFTLSVEEYVKILDKAWEKTKLLRIVKEVLHSS